MTDDHAPTRDYEGRWQVMGDTAIVRQDGNASDITSQVVPYDGGLRTVLEALPPEELLAVGARQATAIAAMIEDRHAYTQIGPKKHVHVDAWCAVAAMNKTAPFEEEVIREEDGGYIAVVELRQLDGTPVARASSGCGMDEKEWARKPAFQRRSMAVTRAVGKACRMRFSWVMVLAGYSPTPYEEMTRDNLDRDESPTVPAESELPTSAQVEFFLKLLKSHHVTDEEREKAQTWLEQKATKDTLSQRIDKLQAYIKEHRALEQTAKEPEKADAPSELRKQELGMEVELQKQGLGMEVDDMLEHEPDGLSASDQLVFENCRRLWGEFTRDIETFQKLDLSSVESVHKQLKAATKRASRKTAK